MKLIYKYLLIIPVFFIASCELTNLDYLENPNAVAPENAELSLFFNNVQLGFRNFYNGISGVGARAIRMESMDSGDTYNNAWGPGSFNGVWYNAYASLIPDLDQIISIADDPDTAIPIYAGASKIMKAYVLMSLVDFFGDVPYSEAGQGVVLKSPGADDQKVIYAEALSLINAAIADFGKSSPNIGSKDIYYGGNSAKWLKFANTVKLKYYITTRLVNAGESATAIAALAPNVILSAADDFVFQYGTNRNNPNSRHPWYNSHYEVGGGAYLSNYYMWTLLDSKGSPDPRLRYYFFRQDCDTTNEDDFTLDCKPELNRPLHFTGPYSWCVASTTGYWGRDHGNNDGTPPDGDKKTCFGVYPAGGRFDGDDCVSTKNSGKDGAQGAGILPIMMSSFSHFMLAEAALTLNVGDAKDNLEKGIRASMSKVLGFGAMDPAFDSSFAPTADDIEAYVGTVLGAFDAASASGKLDIVMKEYHLAAWGNGVEGYNGYRRTGFPSEMQPTREPASGDFPRLMFYPADYVNLNANASQRVITEQVFWDTNPAGFIN